MKTIIIIPFLMAYNLCIAQDKINYAILIGTHDFDVITLQDVFNKKGITTISASIDRQGTEGVERDLENMERFLGSRGFNRIIKLYNKKKLQVMAELDEIKKKIKPTDNLLFYFSGHGGQLKDTNKDEVILSENDFLDEFFFLKDDILIDDEIFDFFRSLPKGVEIIQMMDACHSGTAMALVFNFPKPVITKTEKIQIESKNNLEILNDQDLKDKKNNLEALIKLFPNPIIYLGAASDNSTTFGDQSGSFFTREVIDTIVKVFEDYTIDINYSQLFNQINLNTKREFHFLPFDDDFGGKPALKLN